MQKQTDQPERSEELAREQALTELEQAIGDREQFAGDRDQARIDQQQLSHDQQREEAATSDTRVRPILDDRQARIDREQVNRDVNQESLDNAQHGRDVQQEALDDTRAMLDLPTSEQPVAADAGTIRRGAMERASASRERAETALIRAQAAMARAQAAEMRAQADGSFWGRSDRGYAGVCRRPEHPGATNLAGPGPGGVGGRCAGGGAESPGAGRLRVDAAGGPAGIPARP